jgi:TolB protein
VAPVTSDAAVELDVAFSPDGKQLAFTRVPAGEIGMPDLYVKLVGGGEPILIARRALSPAWSPDGREIAFISLEGGSARIWKVGSGGENPAPLAAGEVGGYSLAWNPGNRILYQTIGNRNIGMIDPVSGQVDLLFKENQGGFLFNPRFSPDGKRIGVYWNISPLRGIWTISRQNGERKFLHGGTHLPVGWSPDGRWIYAANRTGRALEIIAVDTETGSSKSVLEVPVDPGEGTPNHFFVGVAPDGKSFVFSVGKSLTDIWLVENFDQGAR